MKKVKKAISLILCTALLLSGCGSSQSTSSQSTSSQSTSSGSIMDGKDGYTLSEYLSSGETIWYLVDDSVGKDADIDTIYVLNSDGTMYYADSDLTLGEAEQMEDKEIAAMVKADYEENVRSSVGSLIKNREEGFLNEAYFKASNLPYQSYLFWKYVVEKYIDTIQNGGSQEDFIDSFNGEIDSFNGEDEKELLSLWEEEYGIEYILIEYMKVIDAEYKEHLFSAENILKYLDTNKLASDDYSISDVTSDAITRVEEEFEENTQKFIADYQDDLDSIKKALEEYQNDIKPTQYQLSVITDSTGNNTECEVLVYQEGVPLTVSDGEGLYKDVRWFELNRIAPTEDIDGTLGNCYPIYDSWYGMYGYNGYDKYFCTRVSSNTEFKLDEVGTENVTIDVEDKKTLFDTSIVLPCSELYKEYIYSIYMDGIDGMFYY